MDINRNRILEILKEIDECGKTSQRYLAKKLNISLGLVNSYLKGLSKEGYLNITAGPQKRFEYILTPKGCAEKIKLTYEFFQYAFQVRQLAFEKIQYLFSKFHEQKIEKIVFYGAGELAQIAYESMNKTGIQLIGVVDPYRHGEKFMDLKVIHPEDCTKIECDIVFITELIDGQNVDQISNSLNIKRSLCATL